MGLFDAFMGNSQRKDLEAANAEARAALEQGRTESIGTRNEFLGRSTELLQPQIGVGADAINKLRVATGLEGEEAEAEYLNSLRDDPRLQESLTQELGQIEDSAAARGGLFSGNTLKALQDRTALRVGDVRRDRVNELFGLAGIGAGATSQAAGFTQQTGQDIADTQFGTGQLRANNAVNFGNAMAESRGIPINNLLGLVNAGASAAGAYYGAR